MASLPLLSCHLVEETAKHQSCKVSSKPAYLSLSPLPWPSSLCLPAPLPLPFFSLPLLKGQLVRGVPCLPAAVGQNASLVSDINFCEENPAGAGVTNGFYLLLETALPQSLALHTSPFPTSQNPAQRAGNRELPRGTICFCQRLCWAPALTSVENRVLDELLERKVWSPPSSLLVITGMLGSRGWVSVHRLAGLICINWKSVTGS